jgi:hypothetical protein
MWPTRYSGTDRAVGPRSTCAAFYYWLERGEADFEAEVNSEYAEFVRWKGGEGNYQAMAWMLERKHSRPLGHAPACRRPHIRHLTPTSGAAAAVRPPALSSCARCSATILVSCSATLMTGKRSGELMALALPGGGAVL